MAILGGLWPRIAVSLSLLALAALKMMRHGGPSPGWEWVVWSAFTMELGAGVLLLTRAWRVGAVLTAILGMAFLVGLSALRWVAVDIGHCGCFGPFRVDERLHSLVALGLLGAGVALLTGAWGGATEGSRVERR